MTKKDKALIAEALNQICAYMGAIATILGDDDARSRDRPKANAAEEKQPEVAIPTKQTDAPTTGMIHTADAPDPEPADDTSEPDAATQEPEDATTTPGAEPAPPEQSPESSPPKEEITYEDVRAVMAEKARTGYRAEVKALLTAHGVSQLSDADPAIYAQLLAEAEEIGNG